MSFMQRTYSLKQISPKSRETIYPEEIECIVQSNNGIGGIYIGNLEAAQNLNTLSSIPFYYKEYRIKAVLTAAAQTKLVYNKSDVLFHLILPALDHQNFPIQKYFEQSYDFIDKYSQVTNILIHCLAGISRSVSLLIAYLIKKEKISFQSAYLFVKARRKVIHPNQGFIKKLKLFAQYYTKNKKYINPNPEVYQYRTSKLRPTTPHYSSAKFFFLNPNNEGNNTQFNSKISNPVTLSLQKYKFVTQSNQQLNQLKKYQVQFQKNNQYQLDHLKYYNLASKNIRLNNNINQAYCGRFKLYF